ncbi:MAG: ParB/RepB/Spo0J family partition protein [Firmicutes bacterium]|nr:ParB/RepB/Spo0J family partition protein [Bacillota bacterium]
MSATKNKGLGKGLSALIGDKPVFAEKEDKEQIVQVDLKKIAANPHQPRRSFNKESLAELASSIQRHGVMQPLLLTRREDLPGGAQYMIAAGERRFRACQIAGLRQAPCIIQDFSDSQLAEISLIENIQREDLQPLEEAGAYQALLDGYGYTQEQLAERLGKSRPHIANTLRLLQLNAKEQALLSAGRLTPGHARALLAIRNPDRRRELCRLIVENGWSVRQAEEYAKTCRPQNESPKPAAPGPAYSFTQQAARRISEKLMIKASFNGGTEKGKVILEYHNEDDLQRILDALLPNETF